MEDIYKTLAGDIEMHPLINALERAGLAETLQDAGPFTMFAPHDTAFTRMNIETELNDPEKLKSILTYNVVSGKYDTGAIREIDSLETLNGKFLTVALDEGDVVVDNGKFVTTDIHCSNGIIHIIDNVFKPQLSGWYREE